jgi:hypothetical protein
MTNLTDLPDLTVANFGSIFLLTPESELGREWVAQHLPADATTWGLGSIVVEHRYIGDIVQGAQQDGLKVS